MEPPPEKHQSGRFIFPSERDRLFIRLSREMVMDRVKNRSDAKSNRGCTMSSRQIKIVSNVLSAWAVVQSVKKCEYCTLNYNRNK